MDEPAVAGTMVHNTLEFFRQRYGAPHLEAALGALPVADREALEVLPIGWAPLRALVRLYEQLSQRHDVSVEKLHSEAARWSAERTLSTIWRTLLRFTSDSALVQRAPVIYGRTWSKGALSARPLGAGRAELVLSGWPDVPEFALRSLRIGIGTTLELAGRGEVRMTSDRTPDGAIFHASWRS